MITRDEVQQRLASLQAQKAQLESNLSAYAGAIQDCEYWLTVLDQKDQAEADKGADKEVLDAPN